MVNPLADELRAHRQGQPCALVIFGATGDLTRRKLVPSLVALHREGLLSPGFAVVGFARGDWSDEGFRDALRQGLAEHGDGDCAGLDAFLDKVRYHRADYSEPDGYETLKQKLSALDRDFGTAGNRLFYLATPPSAYGPIIQQLKAAGMSRMQSDRFNRVIVEKPIGHDLDSAVALNDQIRVAFKERQVFRIDHYLGKETVQNILALRFANGIFEPLWNEKFIDHVQITVAESIGMEGRGGYFEEAGIVRDMIQNHLLQVLTLVAMEPPPSLDADRIRDEKVKVLRAINTLTPEQVAQCTVRGQYTEGWHGGEAARGYRTEDGVADDSETETYAAIRLHVDNWRWSGTPFLLRSGKRMPRRVTEVAIHFKKPPFALFEDVGAKPIDNNVLLLRVQPDEGISLRFGSKVPGPDLRLRDVRMDFRYGRSFGAGQDAYERLLLDAMVGDSTLFARRDEIEEAWRITDSIRHGWQVNGGRPEGYAAGTWGPKGAVRILGEGRTWRRP